MNVKVRIEQWPFVYPLRITNYEWAHAQTIVVELESDGFAGRGESSGVYYRGDTPERCAKQIDAIAGALRAGIGRIELLDLLPPGGARNAVDCALWELESKRASRPVWELAGLPPPRPIVTTYTLGADEPALMAKRARSFAAARAIKLKLTGTASDEERVRAVREARPDVWLAVDANQGFTLQSLERLMPALIETGVQLIEQPLAIGRDADLAAMRGPLPIAADESVQDINDLARLVGRFDVVNIKLDKCGGLTHGLDMCDEARRLGLKVMVGNMGGTSLAMAPAFVLGQLCDVIDLDGPLLLSSDRRPGAIYDDGFIWCAEEVWGGSHDRR